MECHLNLITWKFLDWRVKLYIEMSRIYEEMGCLISAEKIISRGCTKINEMKAFEELDSPIPKHISQILTFNLRILDALSLKYRLTAEKITPEQWK